VNLSLRRSTSGDLSISSPSLLEEVDPGTIFTGGVRRGFYIVENIEEIAI
jgi:hypothetical protein